MPVRVRSMEGLGRTLDEASGGFPLLGKPNYDDNPADDRDKADELEPATSVGVVQAPRSHCKVGEKRGEEERREQLLAHDPKDYSSNESEERPPPEFRPCCAAAEVGVFGEADTN